MGAVAVALSDLVADDRAADAADDGAVALVAVASDCAAQQGAGDRADGRARGAVGAALFTGFLGHGQGRDERGGCKAGEKKMLTHEMCLLRGSNVLRCQTKRRLAAKVPFLCRR